MATLRAKRLGKYLEETLGWSVFGEDATNCKCGAVVYGDRFCGRCGKKQDPKPNNARVLAEIEAAIKFALMEE